MKFKKTLASLLLFGTVASAAVSVQAAPDYTDETMTFSFGAIAEDEYTSARPKGSTSSMYLYHTKGVEFQAKPEADSHYGEGTAWVQANSRGYFTAIPYKKYAVQNNARERFWDGVQVRFHGHRDAWITSGTATIKWSPDYLAESGVITIGL